MAGEIGKNASGKVHFLWFLSNQIQTKSDLQLEGNKFYIAINHSENISNMKIFKS